MHLLMKISEAGIYYDQLPHSQSVVIIIVELCSIDRANLSNELCFALLWLALAVLHAVNARMTSPD
ncbi:hypothetical protein T02_1054 [Trichinella nativa]|uniref:Uncharacterized protein n=1 Tax=Trichinella nativa TaxID=6335 RepID=A0A0V1LPD0_9BILA|nr:hypothetical protein T02_1054 [Trichinella nativa]